MGEGEVGENGAEREQHDRGDDERDGVALLVRLQPRGDEAPELQQDDRQGEDEPSVGRQVEAKAKPSSGAVT